MLGKIYELVGQWQETEIRLANDGSLFVINLNAAEAQQVYALTKEGGAYDDISASVACVGNHRCDIGVADSQKLLRECMEAVRKENFSAGTLPKMHISGCMSSCGSQQIAPLGWRGCKRSTEDGPVDAYFLNYGGCERQGEEKLTVGSKVILGRDVPAFLVELGRTIEETGRRYEEWIVDNEEKICEIADRYVNKISAKTIVGSV